VDTLTLASPGGRGIRGEGKAKEYLQSRFEACYPFHPATLSVFQRQWQSLPQFQQTRGTLAMLAQWISWAFREGFTQARREMLITLGSAPLHVPEFRSVVLGQLGQSRLLAAIDTDIAGEQSHARALDADTTGVLRDIHRRVGATILFESSGGQVNRVAPPARVALRAGRAEPGHDLDRYMRPRPLRRRRSSSSASGRMASRCFTKPRSTRRFTIGRRRSTRTKSARPCTPSSRRSSNAGPASPWSRCQPTAARCRTRRG
jgi:hypothetical protein